MTINYLILAHDNFHNLDALIDALDAPDVQFFVHIDQKAESVYRRPKSNVHLLQNRIAVYWGGFGIVRATIALLQKAAARTDNGYYCLLSGTDYPIRSNAFIRAALSEGWEYINLLPGPVSHKPIARFNRYYFDFDRKKRDIAFYCYKGLEKGGHLLGIRKHIPFELFVGSQWFALSHHCVKHLLGQIKYKPEYIRFFKTALIPDEAFFQTLVGHSPFRQRVRNNLTYTDWTSGASPRWLTEEHVELFKEQLDFEGPYGTYRPVFARKLNDQSERLRQMIDTQLRQD